MPQKHQTTHIYASGDPYRNPICSIGTIKHKYDLFDQNYEQVVLEFDDGYKGINVAWNDNEKMFTYARCAITRTDLDIISPIITVRSTYRYEVGTMIGGVVSRIAPYVPNPRLYSDCGEKIIFEIFFAGSDVRDAVKFSFTIPHGLNLRMKQVFIPKFNIIIGPSSEIAQAYKELSQINSDVIHARSGIGPDKPLANVAISSDRNVGKTIHYTLNGIRGVTNIKQSDNGKSNIKFELASCDDPIIATLPLEEFTDFDSSKIYRWLEDTDDELKIIIDDNITRLNRTISEVNQGRLTTSDKINKQINQLTNEVEKSRKEKSLSEEAIRQLKLEIEDNKRKEALDKEKLFREKEELRLKSTRVAAKTTMLNDVVKLSTTVVPIIAMISRGISSAVSVNLKTKLMIGGLAMIAGGIAFMVNSVFSNRQRNATT